MNLLSSLEAQLDGKPWDFHNLSTPTAQSVDESVDESVDDCVDDEEGKLTGSVAEIEVESASLRSAFGGPGRTVHLHR